MVMLLWTLVVLCRLSLDALMCIMVFVLIFLFMARVMTSAEADFLLTFLALADILAFVALIVTALEAGIAFEDFVALAIFIIFLEILDLAFILDILDLFLVADTLFCAAEAAALLWVSWILQSWEFWVFTLKGFRRNDEF